VILEGFILAALVRGVAVAERERLRALNILATIVPRRGSGGRAFIAQHSGSGADATQEVAHRPDAALRAAGRATTLRQSRPVGVLQPSSD
jgi:hypothetical protein